MKVKTIRLEGFRNFNSWAGELGEVNLLSGENGSGKSSIKEAVLFALYGKDLNGSNLGLKELVNRESSFAKVTLEFGDYTVQRLKSRASSKLFYFDGSGDDGEVAQRDMESVLPEARIFQCVFDVGFFFRLPENEQRQIIIDNSPSVDRTKLFNEFWGEFLHGSAESFIKKFNVDLGSNLARERKNLQNTRLNFEKGKVSKMSEIRSLQKFITEIEKLIEDERKAGKVFLKDMNKNKVETCMACGQLMPNEDYDRAKQMYDATVSAEVRYQRQIADKEREIKALENQKSASESDMLALEEAIKILAPNNLPAKELEVKIKPIIKYLKTILPDIDIKLMREVQSTLEWNEAFEVSLRAVPYHRLSNGEKLRVGLAFSMLLDKLSGNQVGMFFLDNAESVTGKLPKVEGQLFIAKVVDKQKLKLEVTNG